MDIVKVLRSEREARRKTSTLASASASAPDEVASADDACNEIRMVNKNAPLERLLFAVERCSNGLRKIGGIDSVWVVEDFICGEEERRFWEHCRMEEWKDIRHRNVLHWEKRLPKYLDVLAESLVECGVFPKSLKPDHALLNEYTPPQGIMAHTDGPVYEPKVACLSLGSSAVLKFTERLTTNELGQGQKPKTLCRVLLRPRSLVIFSGNAYNKALHEIEEGFEDVLDSNLANAGATWEKLERSVRISITMRTLRKIPKDYGTMEFVEKSLRAGFFKDSLGVKHIISKKLLEKSLCEAKVLDASQLSGHDFSPCKIPFEKFEMWKMDTIEAVRKLQDYDPVALIFASDTNPGGSASKTNLGTQEEAFCRRSTLFEVQKASKYPIPTEGLLFVPDVQILYDTSGILRCCCICAALRSALAGSTVTGKEFGFLQGKIRGVLNCALIFNKRTIILGAWGTGAFGNPPDIVAQAFKSVLQSKRFRNKFERIVFAIPEPNPNASAFKIFSQVLLT